MEHLDEAFLEELSRLFADEAAFSFALPRVARFPEVAWLAPEPDEPFRALTALIYARYPDYPPYEGIHDEVIPHLTFAEGDSALQDEVESALTPRLPIEASADNVTLIVEDEAGLWRVRERFSLRGSRGLRGQ